MSIERRAERLPVRIDGADAAKLLNDVLCGSIAVPGGPARWWALLSPQGKIQAEGLIGWADGAFWLDVHESVAEAFLKRMRLYKLRAAVTIQDQRASHAVGWSLSSEDSVICHADGRDKTLGFRVIAPLQTAEDWHEPKDYPARRIGLGLSELGPDYAADTHFPHDVGMDLLGGVDFEKGCYVGQEVVSRMQHRGTARRRPVIVSGPQIATGDAVMAGEREAGALGQVMGERGIAIARLDRLSDPDAARVSGRPVSLALPVWARYRFGDSGGD